MRYREEIDGLRALAVLSVIFFHAGFSLFSGGFVGVDIFFVISGYLITSIIASEQAAGKFTYAGFYERRIRRILPALFVVMVACIPFAILWLPPDDLKSFAKSLKFVPAFISNILFYQQSGYFDADAELKPLLHTWSLAVEEQYYLIFPTLLMFVLRFGHKITQLSFVIVAAASLTWAEVHVADQPDLTFYMLTSRFWELLIGAMSGLYLLDRGGQIRMPQWLRELSGLLGLLLILASLFLFTPETPFPSLYALVPTMGAVLLILFVNPFTLVGRLLTLKPLVGIGLISYSAYLWHQPLFAFARYRSLSEPSDMLMLALSALAMAFGYFSWRFIEKPFRDRKNCSRKTIFMLAAIISFAIILIGRYIELHEGRIIPLDNIELAIANGNAIRADNCWDELEKSPKPESACRIGISDAKPSVMLVGDSHAASLIGALGEILTASGQAGLSYTFNSCLPIQSSRPDNAGSEPTTCDQLRNNFFSALNTALIPEIIIMSARWPLYLEKSHFDNGEGGVERGKRIGWINQETVRLGYREALAKDYVESIKFILASGRTVILIYPIPEAGWNVPNQLLKKYRLKGRIDPEDGSTSYKAFQSRNKYTYSVFERLEDSPRLIRVFPEGLLCNTSLTARCITQLDGNPLYRDEDHLTWPGAQLVGQNIKQLWANTLPLR